MHAIARLEVARFVLCAWLTELSGSTPLPWCTRSRPVILPQSIRPLLMACHPVSVGVVTLCPVTDGAISNPLNSFALVLQLDSALNVDSHAAVEWLPLPFRPPERKRSGETSAVALLCSRRSIAERVRHCVSHCSASSGVAEY